MCYFVSYIMCLVMSVTLMGRCIILGKRETVRKKNIYIFVDGIFKVKSVIAQIRILFLCVPFFLICGV